MGGTRNIRPATKRRHRGLWSRRSLIGTRRKEPERTEYLFADALPDVVWAWTGAGFADAEGRSDGRGWLGTVRIDRPSDARHSRSTKFGQCRVGQWHLVLFGNYGNESPLWSRAGAHRGSDGPGGPRQGFRLRSCFYGANAGRIRKCFASGAG